MDLRNKLLGVSRSSLRDHHESELGSSADTNNGGINSEITSSLEDGQGTNDFIAKTLSSAPISGHQEYPEDEIDADSNENRKQEDEKQSASRLVSTGGIGLPAISADIGKDLHQEQSIADKVCLEECSPADTDNAKNQEPTPENENQCKHSTADAEIQSTSNEENDSSSDESRFETLKRQLLSTSTDLVDERWSTLQNNTLGFSFDEVPPGDK